MFQLRHETVSDRGPETAPLQLSEPRVCCIHRTTPQRKPSFVRTTFMLLLLFRRSITRDSFQQSKHYVRDQPLAMRTNQLPAVCCRCRTFCQFRSNTRKRSTGGADCVACLPPLCARKFLWMPLQIAFIWNAIFRFRWELIANLLSGVGNLINIVSKFWLRTPLLIVKEMKKNIVYWKIKSTLPFNNDFFTYKLKFQKNNSFGAISLIITNLQRYKWWLCKQHFEHNEINMAERPKKIAITNWIRMYTLSLIRNIFNLKKIICLKSSTYGNCIVE